MPRQAGCCRIAFRSYGTTRLTGPAHEKPILNSVSDAHFTNPQAFEPERWLSQPGEASSAKRVSMPFGAGPRVCPGRYLALLEIKMAMAMLLAHFDIGDVTTPDGGEAVERMAFTMMPVGLRMRLRERA